MRLARLPKSQGVGGFSEADLQKARKNNAAYAADLTSQVRGLGRKVLAAFAATALERALHATYHDSSRFAANWDLAFNRDIYRETMSPAEYGQSPVGQRGDKGSNRAAVYAAKAAFYQYQPGGGRLVREPIPDGYIWKKVGLQGQVGKPMGIGGFFRGMLSKIQLGAVPRVELFNPIMSAALSRAEPGQNSYAQNAIKTQSTLKGEIQEAGRIVGSGYIPILLRRAKTEIAQNAKYRKS